MREGQRFLAEGGGVQRQRQRAREQSSHRRALSKPSARPWYIRLTWNTGPWLIKRHQAGGPTELGHLAAGVPKPEQEGVSKVLKHLKMAPESQS